jgi:hypothetical protein
MRAPEQRLGASVLLLAIIHRSAWNKDSEKFAQADEPKTSSHRFLKIGNLSAGIAAARTPGRLQVSAPARSAGAQLVTNLTTLDGPQDEPGGKVASTCGCTAGYPLG